MPGVAEVGVARRGGLALAVCAAALLLTGPAVLAGPAQAAVRAGAGSGGLPGAAGHRRARRRAVGAAGAPVLRGLEPDPGGRRDGRGGGQRRGREPAVRGPGHPRPGPGRRDQAWHPARRRLRGPRHRGASIIAAAPVPGVSFTGVAPAARILSVKISGTDTFPTSVTPRGIMDAVQFGA